MKEQCNRVRSNELQYYGNQLSELELQEMKTHISTCKGCNRYFGYGSRKARLSHLLNIFFIVVIAIILAAFAIICSIMLLNNHKEKRQNFDRVFSEYYIILDDVLEYTNQDFYASSGYSDDNYWLMEYLESAQNKVVLGLNSAEKNQLKDNTNEFHLNTSFIDYCQKYYKKKKNKTITKEELEYIKQVRGSARKLNNVIRAELDKLDKDNFYSVNIAKTLRFVDDFNNITAVYENYGKLPSSFIVLTDDDFKNKAAELVSLFDLTEITMNVEYVKPNRDNKSYVANVNVLRSGSHFSYISFDKYTGDLLEINYDMQRIEDKDDYVIIDGEFSFKKNLYQLENETVKRFIKKLFLKAYGNNLTYKLIFYGPKNNTMKSIDTDWQTKITHRAGQYGYYVKWFYKGYEINTLQDIQLAEDNFPEVNLGNRNINNGEIKAALGDAKIKISKYQALKRLQKKFPGKKCSYLNTFIQFGTPRSVSLVHQFSVSGRDECVYINAISRKFSELSIDTYDIEYSRG